MQKKWWLKFKIVKFVYKKIDSLILSSLSFINAFRVFL